MQDQMRRLIELQGIDEEINRVRARQTQCEEELGGLQVERNRVREMVEGLGAQLSSIEEECKQLAQSLVQEKENAEKSEGRLPAIKTQKEYVAVLKEIDTAKKLSRDLEERIASRREEASGFGSEMAEKEEQLKGLEEQAAAQEGELQKELKSLKATLASKAAEREELCKAIPVPLRKRYQQLIDRRGGIAVVPANGGACLGCNIHLPPQLYNSLFRVQEIQACPYCNRLIYVTEGE